MSLVAKLFPIYLPTLILTFLRLASFVAFSPPYLPEAVPVFVHSVVVMALLIGIIPYLPILPQDALTLPNIAIEICCGLIMGSVLRFVVYTLRFTGELLDSMMGYRFGQTLNPLFSQDSGPIESLGHLVAAGIFFTGGFQEKVTHIVWHSFTAVPPGRFQIVLSSQFIVKMMGKIFEYALLFALPIMMAVLTAFFTLLLLNKVLPQLVNLSMSFSVTSLVGFFALLLQISFWLPHLNNLWYETLLTLTSLLRWPNH